METRIKVTASFSFSLYYFFVFIIVKEKSSRKLTVLFISPQPVPLLQIHTQEVLGRLTFILNSTTDLLYVLRTFSYLQSFFWTYMSDPPAGDQPPLNQSIPGLSQAVSHLSALASAAGYRLSTIVFTPHPITISAPPAPPTISFTGHMQVSTVQSSPLLVPQPLPAPRRSSLQSPQRRRPLSVPTSSSAASVQLATKRPSPYTTDIPSSSSQRSPPKSKRTRVSNPSIGSPQKSASFWGTVLADRSSGPPSHTPITSQHLPTFVPSSSPNQSEYAQRLTHTVPTEPLAPHVGTSFNAPESTAYHRKHQLMEQPTLQPQLYMQRHTNPIKRERLPSTASNSHALKRIATSPYIFPQSTQLHQFPVTSKKSEPSLQRSSVEPSPISDFFHRTGSFLARMSPFQSSDQPTRSFRHESIAGPSSGQPLPERVFRQGRGSDLHSHESDPHRISNPILLPHYSPSHSYSASASNVSHARPVSNPTSPKTPPLYDTERRDSLQFSNPEAVPGLGTSSAQLPTGRGRRPGTQQSGQGPQQFSCPKCDATFGRKSDKTRHVRVVHEKSRPFECASCGKTFGEKSNMLKHRASVHDDVRTFRCPYCDVSFPQRAMCDNHVRSVHDKKQAKYFCEQCGLPFSKKVSLHEHYAEAHPQLLQAYKKYEAASADAEALEAVVTTSTIVISGPSGVGPSVATRESVLEVQSRRGNDEERKDESKSGNEKDEDDSDEIRPVYTTR